MTSFERLNARLSGKPVDKIPNLNIAMALVAKCAGVSYREYAQNYRYLVEGNLICVEKYGIDAVSAISDPVREAAAFGANIIFPENGVPYCSPDILGDDCDLKKLRLISPYDNARTLDRIKAVALFRERVGGEIPIIGWVEGVLAECADLRGVSELMFDLAEDEEYLVELMELVYQSQCAFAKAQVDAGADIIGIGNAVASLIGPAKYEQYAFKYDKALVDYVHSLGAKTKLHICGNITPLLPQLKLVAPDILDMDWMVDCKTAVDMMSGTRTCMCGNLDPVAVLLNGSVNDIREKMHACIKAGDNTLILACGCEVPAGTMPENLIAMNEELYV